MSYHSIQKKYLFNQAQISNITPKIILHVLKKCSLEKLSTIVAFRCLPISETFYSRYKNNLIIYFAVASVIFLFWEKITP